MSISRKLQKINACPCKQGNACDRKTFTIFYRMRYTIACPCKHSFKLRSRTCDYVTHAIKNHEHFSVACVSLLHGHALIPCTFQ